jgi:dTDP-4-dehydrorhamnose reductase
VIYGWDDTRLNFATWLLVSLRDGKPVQVLTDRYGSPTFADSLSRAILRLLQIEDGGIFHLAGAECLGRYEFARRLAEGFGLDPELIRPVSSSDFKTKAARPVHPCLVSERASKHGIRIADVGEGIAAMRQQRSIERFVPPARFKS